jgi:hypothetical protein
MPWSPADCQPLLFFLWLNSAGRKPSPGKRRELLPSWLLVKTPYLFHHFHNFLEQKTFFKGMWPHSLKVILTIV